MRTTINFMIIFDILFLLENHPGAALSCFIGLIILNWEVLKDVK